MEFRTLKADEIECRVANVKDEGCQLLLYKDARCDMNILDETLGVFGWQRDHKELKGNIYCGVGIWDETDEAYIWKWDAGAESYTEKGEASDSFKRACVNWGIGRELYTSPFIGIKAQDTRIEEHNGKFRVKDSFTVSQIEYDAKRTITYLVLRNRQGNVVFTYGIPASEATPRRLLTQYCEEHGIDVYEVAKEHNINKTSTNDEINKVLEELKNGQ